MSSRKCFYDVPEHGIVNSNKPGQQKLNTVDHKKMTGNKSGILMFKMEGCGHCVKATAELHKLCEKYQRPIFIVDSRSPIVKQFKPDIEGFPTLYIVTGAGDVIQKQYSGERSAAAFENQLRSVDSQR